LLGKNCIILENNQKIYTSSAIGVKPLLDFEKSFGRRENIILIDKIVGKAAVLIAKKIGVIKIYTPIISEIALQYAKDLAIEVEYEIKVPYIKNRTNSGICPLEESVLNISTIEEGYDSIIKTIQKLMEDK
jgi:hypothetical protein